jgi:hypothetical protein
MQTNTNKSKNTQMKIISCLIRFALFNSLLVLFVNSANASGIDTTGTDKSIIVSYWGTLNNNPGMKLGLEMTRTLSSKYAVNNSVSLLINRKTNTYTSAGIVLNSSLRIIGKRGMYFEHGIDFGYLGSYYDFDFYRTNSNNDIINVGRKWVSSVILGYSFGLGYDFAKKTNTNVQIFVKPGIYYRFPNNNNIFYLNNYSVEMGLALHPKWLNKKNNYHQDTI